jgi:hypothetical protein
MPTKKYKPMTPQEEYVYFEKIKAANKKTFAMYAEKDALVMLLMTAIEQKKPDEPHTRLVGEAMDLLSHYTRLECESYYAEKNACWRMETVLQDLKNKEASKC